MRFQIANRQFMFCSYTHSRVSGPPQRVAVELSRVEYYIIYMSEYA